MHKLLSHWQYQRPAVSSRRMAAHLSLPRIQVGPANHLAGTQALEMSCWDTPGKPDIRVTDHPGVSPQVGLIVLLAETVAGSAPHPEMAGLQRDGCIGG